MDRLKEAIKLRESGHPEEARIIRKCPSELSMCLVF